MLNSTDNATIRELEYVSREDRPSREVGDFRRAR
jgi:hypothetical protein